MGQKTFTAGALNMSLVASNADQLLNVITSRTPHDDLDVTKLVLITFSLGFQVSNYLPFETIIVTGNNTFLRL